MGSTPASKAFLSHVERTAAEPRDNALHRVTLSKIEQINDSIRLLRLRPVEREPVIKFLPGQWLDVHVPEIPKAGGFTITSTPSLLGPSSTEPYLELAIQRSPDNPAAAWLWRPVSEILNQELVVRVGGSFVWPPSSVPFSLIKKVVFIAGGVGINPLMSMFSTIVENATPGLSTEFLYTVKHPTRPVDVSQVQFLDRLISIFESFKASGSLKLFFTGWMGTEWEPQIMNPISPLVKMEFQGRRIEEADLKSSLGEIQEREGTVVYVCGVPSMTDWIVDFVGKQEGMTASRVFCERWW